MDATTEPLARGSWFQHLIVFDGEPTDVADALAVFEGCNTARLADKAVCRDHTGMVLVTYVAPNGPHVALAIALSKYRYQQPIKLTFHSPAPIRIWGGVTLLDGAVTRAELERGSVHRIWSSDDLMLRTYSTAQRSSEDGSGRFVETTPLRSCIGLLDGFSTLTFPVPIAGTSSSPYVPVPAEAPTDSGQSSGPAKATKGRRI